jgi:MYXO-CTERM domain-containing protein
MNSKRSHIRAAVALATVVGGSVLSARDAQAANTIVSCLGEQTTYSTDNAAITAADFWPELLVAKLGAGYTVYNEPQAEGNNSLEILGGTAVSAASKAGPPGIVVFGPFVEHDYADHTTATAAQYQAAYTTAVEEFLSLTPAPKVYVMTPPPVGFVWGKGVTADFITKVVDASVLAVAQAKGLTVIDLYTDAYLGMAAAGSGDGHFSVDGLAEVAKLAYEAISGTSGDGGTGASSGSGSGASSGGSGAASGTSSGTSSGTATTGTSAGTGTATSGATATSGTVTTTSGATAETGTATSGTVTTGGTGSTSGDTTATSGTGPSATAGSSSQSGSNSASAGTGGGTTTDEAPAKSSSGCTMSEAGSSGGAIGLLALFGLALFGARKRSVRR